MWHHHWGTARKFVLAIIWTHGAPQCLGTSSLSELSSWSGKDSLNPKEPEMLRWWLLHDSMIQRPSYQCCSGLAVACSYNSFQISMPAILFIDPTITACIKVQVVRTHKYNPRSWGFANPESWVVSSTDLILQNGSIHPLLLGTWMKSFSPRCKPNLLWDVFFCSSMVSLIISAQCCFSFV